MAKKTLQCEKCGGEMKKSREAKMGGGCLLCIIGLIALIFFPIGTIIGTILIIIGLFVGSQSRYIWVCKNCKYQFERRRDWWEFW